MEIIILGLLMLKSSTIYEISKHIKINFTSISSQSMGSIQATMKKLLSNGLAVCEECTQNGVNKKVYSLTAHGRAYFMDGISKPMLYKEKNMEFGKFFFMGFVRPNKRMELIDAYIAALEHEQSQLMAIRPSARSVETSVQGYADYLQANDLTEDFAAATAGRIALQGIRDIVTFQLATLEFAIDKVAFEINWFRQFKSQVEGAKCSAEGS